MSESVTRTERLAPEPAEALAHLLGVEPPTRHLPPLWHWIYLLERPPQTELGPDGHPRSGIPAPPGPGLRRMFAGGRVTAYGQLELDRPATRQTRVLSTQEKQGRSGPLTFVTVRHEYRQGDELVVADEADIVYRQPGPPLTVTPGTLDMPPVTPAREPYLRLTADPTLLFRFSALTYNAHRIHYDLTWCRVEGYPDLVVHGPLQALLMGELIRRHGGELIGRTFAYRLRAPMIGPQTFTVIAAEDGIDAGAEVRDVHDTVTATATLVPATAG
jgi:Uncharacterized conserved protein